MVVFEERYQCDEKMFGLWEFRSYTSTIQVRSPKPYSSPTSRAKPYFLATATALSRVSSSRYSGLEEDWLKGKAPGAAKTLEIGASKATVTIMRTGGCTWNSLSFCSGGWMMGQ